MWEQTEAYCYPFQDIVDVSNADFTSIIFKRYIRSVLTRMQHYTDELLFSCLQLVLNVPRAFAYVKMLIGPLKLAFKVRCVWTNFEVEHKYKAER